MKICMLTWEFPPRIVGGIGRHCFGLAKTLAKEGHDVHVVTLDFPGALAYEEIHGAKIYRTSIDLGNPDFITWTFLFNHFMEKKVATLGRKTEFDIIHIHDWLTAPVGIASKHYLKRPLVSTIHSTEIGRARGLHNPDSYLINGLEWWATYESERVIVTSNSMKYELESQFRLPGEKIDVIPNAIDGEKYNEEVNHDIVKNRYGIAPHERIVLFIGRLVPQKGVEYLIRAMPQIVGQHRNVKFVFTGDGWTRDHLVRLAASNGCWDKVRFVGFVSDSELIDLTLCADVLVIPSIYEPFGIVALEGMAAGVPVVASNVGGLAEVVEHDRTGVLVYPENPGSIAWGVNKVLSDYGYSRWLIQNAKRKIEELYGWEAVAKRTAEVYKKSCERW